MRHLKITLFILTIGILLSACHTNDNHTDKRVIETGKALMSPTDLKASDYFSEISYVPLETTDSCLIGNSPELYLLDDYILVTTAMQQCFLFDKKTGKFKRQIGHVGNDPGGYSNVDCIVDEQNGRLLFYGWNHDLIGYGLDGEYLGKIKIPAVSDSHPESCFCLNEDTIIGYYRNMLGNDANRMLYFKEDGEQVALFPNERICPAFEINRISVWKGEPAVKEFGPVARRGCIYMEGQDPETANVIFPGNSNLWNAGGKTYLKEPFNDTIFQVQGTIITPYLLFDNGELAWEYPDRFRKEKSKGVFITQVLDSECYLFCSAITHLYNKEKRKTYTVAFDKVNGDTRVSLSEKGITDDLNGFLSLHPQTVSRGGEYGGLFSAEEIADRLGKYSRTEVPKSLDVLREIKDEQNPVVVIMK